MTLEYEIIENIDTKVLSQTVQQFLDNGWELHGELTGGVNGYAQAMKREKFIAVEPNWELGYDAAVERGRQYKREILKSPDMIPLEDAVDQYRFNIDEMLVLEFEGVKVCPSWQFSPYIQPYMKPLNETFKDCWWTYLFLTQIEPAFDGKTPLQMLSSEKSQKVLELAQDTVIGL